MNLGSLYDEVRKTVVLVECVYERKPPPVVDFDLNDVEDKKCAALVKLVCAKVKTGVVVKRFGGVVIHRQGYVLTIAHAIPKSFKEINLKFVDGLVLPAKYLGEVRAKNLTLLKVKTDTIENLKFSLLSEEQSINAGKEIFCISHPPMMPFSFETGVVSYPYKENDFPNRTVMDIAGKSVDSRYERYAKLEDDKHAVLLEMSDKCPLLQMCKFYGSMALSPWSATVNPPYSDSEGAPIFNSEGKVLGILAFTLSRNSFAIPLGVIKEFLKVDIPKEIKEILRGWTFPLTTVSQGSCRLTEGCLPKTSVVVPNQKMATTVEVNEEFLSQSMYASLHNKMCKVVVMVECKRKFSASAIKTNYFGGVSISDKGYVLVVSHSLPSFDEHVVEMNCKKYGDERVWTAKCFVKDPKRGLALLKLEVNEGNEVCVLSQEECILQGKKIFCSSPLYGLPFSFEIGEVSYPHLVNVEEGKPFQNRTVGDVIAMWDDGGLQRHLQIGENPSYHLGQMDKSIPLLQMSKFTGSLGLCPLKKAVDCYYDSHGAPIFGAEGEVIGIFAFSVLKISFAIPIEVVKRFLSDHLPS